MTRRARGGAVNRDYTIYKVESLTMIYIQELTGCKNRNN